jgi:hypothetical protein
MTEINTSESNQRFAVVAKAFLKAQKEFGPALKSSTNPAFRSKYADLSACIEAVIGALHNNGFALTQRTEVSANVDHVHVETTLIHESGEVMRLGVLELPVTKKDAHGFGSALTYARRYSLLASMGVAPEDDDGNASIKGKEATPAPKHSPTQGSFETLPKDRQQVVTAVANAVIDRFNADDEIGAYDEYTGIEDAEEKIALWSKLDSKVRSAIKRQAEQLKGQK